MMYTHYICIINSWLLICSGCSSGCDRSCSLQDLQCKVTWIKLKLSHEMSDKLNTSKLKASRYMYTMMKNALGKFAFELFGMMFPMVFV